MDKLDEAREVLRERMERLGVREEEFRETFIRSSGPGGQKVNLRDQVES